MGDILTDNLFT